MRADKLIEVSEKLKIAVKNLNAAQKEYEGALRNYQLVENSFDFGEEVYVSDSAYHPMISRSRYLGRGTIVKIYDDYFYDVKMDREIYGTLKLRCNFLTRSDQVRLDNE